MDHSLPVRRSVLPFVLLTVLLAVVGLLVAGRIGPWVTEFAERSRRLGGGLLAATLAGLLAPALLLLPPLRRGVFGATDARVATRWVAILMGVGAVACGLAVISGERHDYPAFTGIWANILDGEDPWLQSSGNTYAPLFNLLAAPAALDPLAPKVLFVLMWLGCGTALLGLAARRGADQTTVGAVAAVWLFNPMLWRHIPIAGFFDVLPAALCLAAVHLRVRNRDGAAGVVLALGALLKVYPLVLLPFLMLDGKRLRWRAGFACMATVVAGLGLSWMAWGDSTWHPFLYAGERESKLLSVFAFLRGRLSPLWLVMDSPNLDRWSLPAMALGCGTVLAVCWLCRVPVVPACLAGMIAALTLYKVGHPQFLAVVVLLAGYWIATRIEPWRPSLVVALTCYLGWATLFEMLYLVSQGMTVDPWAYVRDLAGLPTFVLAGWLVVEMLRSDMPLAS